MSLTNKNCSPSHLATNTPYYDYGILMINTLHSLMCDVIAMIVSASN